MFVRKSFVFFCNGKKCITTFLIRPILIGDSVIGPKKFGVSFYCRTRMNVSVFFPPKNKCKKGSIAHDATVKSFLSQPHQFTAVLEFYRTEWVRLDAAQQGGGSCLFDVTNQSGEIAKSVFCKMVCVF